MLERENAIIGTIYDAVLDPTLWPKVLEQIVEYTESKTAIFTVLDQLNPDQDFVYTHQIPEAGLVAYQDERVKVIDMRLHTQLWQAAGIGGVINQDLSHYASMPAGSDEFIFYDKCLKPTGVCYITAVLLDAGQYRWGVLGLHRALSRYSQRELDILRRLGTHLRRALQIYRQLCLVKQQNQNLYQLLDCLKMGVILVDQNSQLTYSNLKAQKVIEKSKLLQIDRFNRIKAPKEYQTKLHQHIQSALFYQQAKSNLTQFENYPIGGVLALTDQQSEQKLMLSIVPFAKFLNQNIAEEMTLPKAAIFITATNQYVELSAAYLTQVYKLSNREIQICELFANGLNLEEIAEQRGLTLSSVRTYLKQIYAKTECNSQAELMKSLMATTINFEHIA